MRRLFSTNWSMPDSSCSCAACRYAGRVCGHRRSLVCVDTEAGAELQFQAGLVCGFRGNRGRLPHGDRDSGERSGMCWSVCGANVTVTLRCGSPTAAATAEKVALGRTERHELAACLSQSTRCGQPPWHPQTTVQSIALVESEQPRRAPRCPRTQCDPEIAYQAQQQEVTGSVALRRASGSTTGLHRRI